MPTIKELKEQLQKSNARWTVNEKLLDSNELPKYRTGGLTEKLPIASSIKNLDFKEILKVPTTNPFINARRIENKILLPSAIHIDVLKGSSQILQPGEGIMPLTGGTLPTTIDWRNRFGWPWITSIRDQNGCEACWCFAAVALVEAMVRIEHCVWPQISEGDVHKGMGAHCCDCGDPANALNWMKDHGAADPGCYPWPVTASGCSGCGGTGGGPYDGVTYTPSPDRSGRTIKIPAFTSIGSVSDQKAWLDNVGPIVTGFTVWQDFFSVGSGIYHKVNMLNPTTPNSIAGGHIMLIVGYDDLHGCWIVKNSWSTTFGDHGYCRIGYGETDIDTWAKLGLTGTNPDPWTKRRVHSGALMESGNGANHRNFEMLTTAAGSRLHHWWRDNAAPGMPWHSGVLFGNDAAVCPTFTGTTFNRNFEAVYLTTTHRLHHWWFNQSAGTWNDGGVFGPTDAAGIPGFLQGNYGAPGNFEVVVRTADSKLTHCWRDGGGWHVGVKFGNNISYSGASLVQTHHGTKGNLELVAVNGTTHQMQHFWRDNDAGMVWHEGVLFGANIASPPCMIEGQYGAADEKSIGNFELCVAVNGQVQHWWKANVGDGLWRNSATFGHNVMAVAALLEGSYGFNLEVIVLRTDNKLQHYWRDGAGWHEGVIIGDA
jgi:hypothetical protein